MFYILIFLNSCFHRAWIWYVSTQGLGYGTKPSNPIIFQRKRQQTILFVKDSMIWLLTAISTPSRSWQRMYVLSRSECWYLMICLGVFEFLWKQSSFSGEDAWTTGIDDLSYNFAIVVIWHWSFGGFLYHLVEYLFLMIWFCRPL